MKLIIPMAGMGKRMRPHTLTIPKPLIPIAGKPIVQRLAESLANASSEPVDEIAFIVGNFGGEVEQKLRSIAEGLNAKCSIYYQDEALGTAHAILCAADSLQDKLIVAFADTLFIADFKIDTEKDGIIWVQKVDDPSAFGVVKINKQNEITDFIEKPENFVSDLAIIGIYYFHDGQYLKSELQYLIDNDIKDKGEYQLTNALENMKNKGSQFIPGQVNEWLDCGNKDATVNTNKRILENFYLDNKVNGQQIVNSVLIPPFYLGKSVVIENSVVGPHISIGDHTRITNSNISNSIIQNDTNVNNANVTNSMIGNHVTYIERSADVSIGDFVTIDR